MSVVREGTIPYLIRRYWGKCSNTHNPSIPQHNLRQGMSGVLFTYFFGDNDKHHLLRPISLATPRYNFKVSTVSVSPRYWSGCKILLTTTRGPALYCTMFVSILRLPPECYQTDSDNGSTVGCRNRPTNGCSNRLRGTCSLPRIFFKLFVARCSVFTLHLKVLWVFRVFLVTTGMILYIYLNYELHWPTPTLQKELVFWRHVCSEG